jgi:hypothetical protein
MRGWNKAKEKLPLPFGERAGVRGFRCSMEFKPSPGALKRADLSLRER